MSISKKLLFVSLLIVALFSNHARKLISLASIAVETDAMADDEDSQGSGGASCI